MSAIPLPHVRSFDRYTERPLVRYQTSALVKEVKHRPVRMISRRSFTPASGNLGNRWRYGHATVRSNGPYQVAFEGIVGSSFQVRYRTRPPLIINRPSLTRVILRSMTSRSPVVHAKKKEAATSNRQIFADSTIPEKKIISTGHWIKGQPSPTIRGNYSPRLGFFLQITIWCFLSHRPTVDHTTGTSAGYYVYIESSYPQKNGDKAWLVSEVLESPRGACLDFWYHMKGATTGNMTVYHRILDKMPVSLWFMQVNHLRRGKEESKAQEIVLHFRET